MLFLLEIKKLIKYNYIKAKREVQMLRIIDLFAGLGGIRLGFQQAMNELGLETECVFSSEIKPYAIKAYNGFYGDEKFPRWDDIKAKYGK